MYKLVVEQRYSESIKLCVDALKEIHKEEICLAVNSIPERNVVINLAYQIGRCRNV